MMRLIQWTQARTQMLHGVAGNVHNTRFSHFMDQALAIYSSNIMMDQAYYDPMNHNMGGLIWFLLIL